MHSIKKKNRLSQKMMRWFLLIVLLPTLALSLLIFVMVYQHSYETRISDKRTVLSVIADGVESNANLVMHVVDTTCYDANIENLLGNSHLSTYNQVISQIFSVRETLVKSKTLLSNLLGEIYVFADNDFVQESYWYTLSTARAEETEDYHRFMDMNQTSGWVGTAWIYPASTTPSTGLNKQMLCYYKKIYRTPLERVGVVKCGVDVNRFFSSAIPENYADFVGAVYAGQPIYGSLAVPTSFSADMQEDLITLENDCYLLHRMRSMDQTVLMLRIDQQELQQQALLYALPYFLLTLMTGMMMLISTQLFLRSINRRINQAVAVAENVKNDFLTMQLPNQEQDEMSVLIDAFNALITQLQQEADERIRHEKSKKHALRLALQYQMNPHFLFNTLNWLQMSVELGEPAESISHAIALTGKLLRYNLNEETTATLAEETEAVKIYVQLMNMRKHEHIELSIHTEQMPQQLILARFLFQPLCENAIQHGLISGQPLHIAIVGQMKGEYVRFDIWNDGTVIPSERLESLDLEHRNKSKKNSVGLANVQARLKLMYGSDAQVQITSEPGKTCVSLIFTCKTYGEKE